MRSLAERGRMLFVVAAAAAFGGSCFSDYSSDCSRNVDLACYWSGVTGGSGGTGGTGGTGGSGGAPAVCGDGVADIGEECDDGNTLDCDGCRGDCSAVESCGDGLVCAPEECDQGAANLDEGDCTTKCRNAVCGDGFVQAGEECDDGNAVANDGCSACKLDCSLGNLPVAVNQGAVFRDAATLHCYARVDKSQKSWLSARAACTSWGGDLAALSSGAELATITTALDPPNSVWTGGNDQVVADTFVWSNGEPWSPAALWGDGEPDDAGAGPNTEACVTLGTDDRFHDLDCTALQGYMCERTLPGAP